MSAQFLSAKPERLHLVGCLHYQYAGRFVGRPGPSCEPAASCSAQGRATSTTSCCPHCRRGVVAQPARYKVAIDLARPGRHNSTDLSTKLACAAADVQSQTAAEEAAAAAEAAAAEADARDDSKAHSVGLGLHIRGRAMFQEGATDENDPARLPFHKLLSRAAMMGTHSTAEAVLEDMANAGLIPGPRAYHALVYSYAKSGDDGNALAAIRKCWDAGITPLPETYAAVVAVHVAAGNLVTAEAVYASNRRAGVDCTKSWSQLVTAFFKDEQPERATELLSQVSGVGVRVVGFEPCLTWTHPGTVRGCDQPCSYLKRLSHLTAGRSGGHAAK